MFMFGAKGSNLIPQLDKIGRCCVCLRDHHEGVTITGMIFINNVGPSEAHGTESSWGCHICGLPPLGAVAVICDECEKVLKSAPVKGGFRYLCAGPLADDIRIDSKTVKLHLFNHCMLTHDIYDQMRQKVRDQSFNVLDMASAAWVFGWASSRGRIN